jgi:hypothetical protein
MLLIILCQAALSAARKIVLTVQPRGAATKSHLFGKPPIKVVKQTNYE